MDLVSLLVVVIVLGLVYWAVHRLAGAFGLPSPVMVIIDVVLVVIFVLYLLQVLGLWSGGPSLRLR
jgi:hypothetical protein